MTAAWPTVVDRLVTIFTGLMPTGTVFDGPPVTSATPTDYVTVGYVEDDIGGSFEVDTIYDGSMFIESGTVVCRLVAQSGSAGDLPACRARVFAVAAAFEALVRADHTLGILSPEGTCSTSTEVESIQNKSGAAQSLLLTVVYSTRR